MKTLSVGIQSLIRLAGFAQIGLVFGSFTIPKVLNWRPELMKVRPLIKQMFWTYAAYILVINFSFGSISIFDFKELTEGSKIGMFVTGFIGVYWASRVFIQFFYFERTDFPIGKWYKAGEILLVVVFVSLSMIYCRAFYVNYILYNH